MTTWSTQTKHSTSYSGATKHSTAYTNQALSLNNSYLLRENSGHLLRENGGRMIIKQATALNWTAQTKH